MSWSAEFIARLESGSTAFRWYLEFVPWRHSDGIGGAFTMSSHEPDTQKRLTPEVSVTGASVDPGSWRYTHGGFSIGLTGELWHVFSSIRLGNLARLLLGFPGWSVDQFQPIAIGVLRDIQGKHPNYTLQFVDILQSLQVRSTTNPDKLALFGSLESAPGTQVATTVLAKYTPGNSTIGAASTAGFDEGDTQGAIRVDPAPGGYTGEPFYLLFSGKTATTFTGLSPVDKHGTAQECVGVDAEIEACAFLEGHPLDISKQLLTSTGAGDNGASDVLPETWGFGVPSEWIDTADMNRFRAVMGTTRELHEWSVIIEDPQATGMDWWAGYLSVAGAWLVVRQGAISARICQNPITAGAASTYRYFEPVHSGITITHSDIEEIEEFQAWAPAPSAESSMVEIHYNASHAVGSETYQTSYEGSAPRGSLASSPGVAVTALDMTDPYWGGSAGAPYPGDAPLDVLLRTIFWIVRRPERIAVRCRGLRLAQLCAGDLVYLTSYLIQGRLAETAGGYQEQVCMVSGITVDWSGGTVALELVVPSMDVT